MIDTARLSTTARPTEQQFTRHWRKREDTQVGKSKQVEYFFNHPDIPIRATYRKESKQGPDQLLLEMSLPKVCFGNNWQMISNIPAAVAEADKLVQALHEALPPLPSVGQVSLSRLDVCYNYEVGPLLPYYIQAFSRLDYPHRTTVSYNSETVEFRAKAVKSKVYDKYAETRGQAPSGLLRHEVTFHRAREIRNALGFTRPVSLNDLTPDLLKYTLQRDLHRLGIFEKSFATYSDVLPLLRRHFTPSQAHYRFVVLSLYQTLERSQICDQLSIDRNTLNRLLAEIRNIGISLALTEHDQPLPPLEVSW